MAFVLVSASCQAADAPAASTNPPSSTPVILPSPVVETISQPTLTPLPAEVTQPTPIPLERTQYFLNADMDYPNHRVIVEERILISHPSDQILNEIDLVVPPNSWPGVFSIQEISSDLTPIEGYEIKGVTLNIRFNNPGWQPGNVLDLQIQFVLNLPEQNARQGFGPSPFGYTALQTNLVDWYPMVPPYQPDQGWLIHDPWLFGEYLVYPAVDFEVTLRLDTPGLITAASTIPSKAGDPLQYSLKQARNFVFSISPSYTVLEGEVNGTKVLGYIFPGYQVPGQAAFEATMDALDLYSDLFGPYDQAGLTMVQADFNHGMEYEGLYFQSRGFFDTYSGSEQSYLVAIAVHETAHQWWYGQVANDQALEPWLDEALCTFSELLYYEHRFPQSVDWWWGTRVNFYQPQGRIDRPIYGYQEYTDQYLNYRDATYLQGAKFFAALRDEIGTVQFYSLMMEYASRFKNGIATEDDFFSLLAEYDDVLKWVWLSEYFEVD